MLERFLIQPEMLTDEDVMDILKQAFSQESMERKVAEIISARTGGESLTE